MNKRKMSVVAALVGVSVPALVWISQAAPKPFFVASGSMEPSVAFQSQILVRPYAAKSQVRRGDVIVHRRLDKSIPEGVIDVVTRVVALPGDKVRLSGTNIWINGQKLKHSFVRRMNDPGMAPKTVLNVLRETNNGTSYEVAYQLKPLMPQPAEHKNFSITVPANKVFTLGDNRNNALDSRFTGPVPLASILGKKTP